ncbi:MAG: DUF3592 domain-containing protein [Polaromonas sp.]|nr:DUF3592 domain-containing protein [Polaromonas sp.]
MPLPRSSAKPQTLRPRTPVGRFLRGVLVWLVPGFGFLMAAALAFSPAFIDAFGSLFEEHVQVQARVSQCQPWRDGMRRASTIRCQIDFSHDGQPYSLQRTAWTSQSPFLTSEGLSRALAAQSAVGTRRADFRADRPDSAYLPDTRWLALPAAWVWLLGLFVGLVALLLRLDPSTLPWRRAELAPDPVTGHLEPLDGRHQRRVRRRLAAQCGLAAAALGLCLFGLSNQPVNLLGKAAMGALQPVPAQLAGCLHQRTSSYRGHDQINCAFDYRVAGQSFRGQAESLDFRYFPTRARLDAEVARLQPGPAVTAYVDTRYPSYAWAFIRDDAFIKFTWGLFELELALLIAALAGFIVWTGLRWVRAGRDGAAL